MASWQHHSYRNKNWIRRHRRIAGIQRAHAAPVEPSGGIANAALCWSAFQQTRRYRSAIEAAAQLAVSQDR
jgi:hypothetical protein